MHILPTEKWAYPHLSLYLMPLIPMGTFRDLASNYDFTSGTNQQGCSCAAIGTGISRAQDDFQDDLREPFVEVGLGAKIFEWLGSESYKTQRSGVARVGLSIQLH